MNYTNFFSSPIVILGINESYDVELLEIANLLRSDIAYTGAAEDLDILLPYFVFVRFSESRQSSMSANTGENYQLAEFTQKSTEQQRSVWNRAVGMLKKLCDTNLETANVLYLSKVGRW
jgi:hypothetical protein